MDMCGIVESPTSMQMDEMQCDSMSMNRNAKHSAVKQACNCKQDVHQSSAAVEREVNAVCKCINCTINRDAQRLERELLESLDCCDEQHRKLADDVVPTSKSEDNCQQDEINAMDETDKKEQPDKDDVEFEKNEEHIRKSTAEAPQKPAQEIDSFMKTGKLDEIPGPSASSKQKLEDFVANGISQQKTKSRHKRRRDCTDDGSSRRHKIKRRMGGGYDTICNSGNLQAFTNEMFGEDECIVRRRQPDIIYGSDIRKDRHG
ncbi:unnamed protein product [Notodromas monacha]|uniref:Uncharacterized protein n=1 Tax=Notodromas monacha TaxID=399045 RepID=A0A7R9C1A6_9CRUS|nr:unnamed protein product [Notodromas monacha]CAG0924487.1 unnamed protein product [Notodromas monacha]